MDATVVVLCTDDKETPLLRDAVAACGLTPVLFKINSEAVNFVKNNNICAVVAKLGSTATDHAHPVITAAKKKNPQIFCSLFSYTGCNNAVIRSNCTEVGTNMITCNIGVLKEGLTIVREFVARSGAYACTLCNGGSLTEDELLRHTFCYHNQMTGSMLKQTCPICNKICDPLPVHLFNEHGHNGRREPGHLPEKELTVRNTYTFTLVVCRRKRDNKFLLVQEVCSWGWWLPGGRINQGEDLVQSAVRETKEESGVDVKITGVLRFEYVPRGSDARFRVIFYAEPIDENQEPKTIPDFESMAASYVDAADLVKLPLRGREPLEWFHYVNNGGTIHPITLLTKEGAPAPTR